MVLITIAIECYLLIKLEERVLFFETLTIHAMGTIYFIQMFIRMKILKFPPSPVQFYLKAIL